MLIRFLLALILGAGGLKLLNVFSYSLLKSRIIRSRPSWGLNICCGKTDGGGVNADIHRHMDVPRYVQIDDIYNLPFGNSQFDTVLCSHTIEHVDDPERFFAELTRVGKDVTLILPPLWDISAAFNVIEHRTLFLTMRKRHNSLPRHVPLPGAATIQRWFGQRIHA